MLFDPRPKQDKKDLFGRDLELSSLLNSLRSECPLILLLGVRRVGKTSLLKVALKEAGQPYIYLDLRSLEDTGFSRTSLYRMLSDELSRLYSTQEKLREYLKKVRGIEIAGFKIELNWGSDKLLLSSLFKALNDWVEESNDSHLILAFDEAQLLRFMAGGKGKINFRSLLAYSYDNLPNLKFVLTGSEVGLLMSFIGAENPESPLYGRYREEILLEKFNREKSIKFLEAGFKEHNIEPDFNILQKVVDKLDGIVGWLTYYGYKAVREKKLNSEILESVFEEAKAITSRELEKIVQRSKYYKLVLKAIALENNQWSNIKRIVEAWCERPISNAHLTRILKNLIKLGVVQKANGKYQIIDPVVKEVAKKY